MANGDFRLKEKTYRCYFELTLDLIGGKWKPVVLYHIGHHGVLIILSVIVGSSLIKNTF